MSFVSFVSMIKIKLNLSQSLNAFKIEKSQL
jgi:hypothetical protein